jgi:hypothetical protein
MFTSLLIMSRPRLLLRVGTGGDGAGDKEGDDEEDADERQDDVCQMETDPECAPPPELLERGPEKK